jgi:hypothetical protein
MIRVIGSLGPDRHDGSGQWQGATPRKWPKAGSRRFPDLREDEAERASRVA